LKKKRAASREKKNDRDNGSAHGPKRAIQDAALQSQCFGRRRDSADFVVSVLAAQLRVSIETSFEHVLLAQ
jgi:hypothetical protein